MAGLETPDELRAFDYYRNRSAVVLGGGVSITADEFWGGLVVKLTATEPAVRHAVLALSSLHESVSRAQDRGRSPDHGFAFQEYGKAIAAVRNWDMKSDAAETAVIPLLVCVLFVCIEFLMEYEEAAQIHICQGRLILSRMDRSSLSSPALEVARNVLVPIYARLSLATFLFGTRPEAIPAHLAPAGGESPATFESLREARDALYHLVDQGLRASVVEWRPAIYDPNTEAWQMYMMESAQQEMLTKMAQWNAAFSVFEATTTDETASSRVTRDLMHMYYHAVIIWISTSLSALETVYDSHEAGFAAIVSRATSIIAESGSLSREDAAFTFETEVAAPLYWVASKCRQPFLRRAALNLLRRDEVQRRRENLWRTQELVVVVSRLIEMEEGIGTALQNDDLSDLYAAHGGYWHSDDELKVPTTRQPTLTKPMMGLGPDQLSGDIAPETSLDQRRHVSPAAFSPLPQDIEMAAAMPKIDSRSLTAPYGVPESRRIKNALIGPSKPGGVWITTFEEPLPGQLEWHTRKAFLKV